jgi:hypothetical protein
LYDLKADISEKTNVAEKHADIVAKMDALLKGARTDSADWPIKKPKAKAK